MQKMTTTTTSEELNADELNQYDPHVWTSPVNAKIMVQNILQTLCEVDPDNADYYTENANDYLSQLDQLDQEIRTVVANGNRKEIVFGSRFCTILFLPTSTDWNINLHLILVPQKPNPALKRYLN